MLGFGGDLLATFVEGLVRLVMGPFAIRRVETREKAKSPAF